MTVYVVYFYDKNSEEYRVGNVYENKQQALDEAQYCNGVVISRYVC